MRGKLTTLQLFFAAILSAVLFVFVGCKTGPDDGGETSLVQQRNFEPGLKDFVLVVKPDAIKGKIRTKSAIATPTNRWITVFERCSMSLSKDYYVDGFDHALVAPLAMDVKGATTDPDTAGYLQSAEFLAPVLRSPLPLKEGASDMAAAKEYKMKYIGGVLFVEYNKPLEKSFVEITTDPSLVKISKIKLTRKMGVPPLNPISVEVVCGF